MLGRLLTMYKAFFTAEVDKESSLSQRVLEMEIRRIIFLILFCLSVSSSGYHKSQKKTKDILKQQNYLTVALFIPLQSDMIRKTFFTTKVLNKV